MTGGVEDGSEVNYMNLALLIVLQKCHLSKYLVTIHVLVKAHFFLTSCRIFVLQCIMHIIVKITISLIVIGLKISYMYFPLIHLPSCYQIVFYRTVQ